MVFMAGSSAILHDGQSSISNANGSDAAGSSVGRDRQ
jgi:hypothetical protein